jgi:hypothetical protein
MRESFEARYAASFLQRRGDGYAYDHVQEDWDLWCEAWKNACDSLMMQA